MPKTSLSEIIRKVKEVEENTKKQLEDFTRDDLIYILQEVNYSAPSFKNAKMGLKQYIETEVGEDSPLINSLKSIKVTDVDQTTNLGKKYFGDFHSLSEEFEISKSLSMDADLEDAFDIQKACMWLAWAGVTIEDACNLLKEDILDEENTIQLPNLKKIQAPLELIQFLREFKQSGYYSCRTSRGTIKSYPYKKSSYLLRTNKSAQLQSSHIRVLLSNFNTKCYVDSNKFTYFNIYNSGIFYRAYEKELEYGEFPQLKDRTALPLNISNFYKTIFNRNIVNKNQIRTLLLEYNAWKKCFYGE